MLKSTTGFRARLVGCGVVTAALAGALAFTTGPVAAQNGSGSQCSTRTLRGGYGFLVSGFKPVPPPMGGGLERFNAVGVFEFDGEGTFTFEPGGALIGEIAGVNPDPTNPDGTYEVNPNCTGTMEWQPDLAAPVFLRFTIAVVDNGRQIKLGGRTGLSQGEAVRK